MSNKKKRTFADDDLFHREDYADFLKELILNCDNYHRDDDVKAYTIALDSPWGTGKSVFLEKFEAMLEQDCQDQLRVVHYNAWENDFWDNAFEPFADAVFSHPLFASPLADQTEGSAGKKFGDALKHLALAFAKKRLDDYFDSPEMMKALEAAMNAAGAAASQKPTIISPKYSAYKMSIQTIQDAMENVLAENAPEDSSKTVKLVIIIDELDRCRPTFAIETLEIVKHVMDVPNVVYLFALDIQQLGAAVKQVYGPDTDATGYLMRFFSYYSRLSEASADAMIGKLIDSTKNIDEKDLIKQDLVPIVSKYQLSPRDIETIGKVYQLMMNNFLSSYKNRQAYLLYWTLLCWKYKDPSSFANLSKGSVEKLLHEFLFSDNKQNNFCVRTALKLVQGQKIFKNCRFSKLSIDSTRESSEGILYKVKPNDGKNKIDLVWKRDEFCTILDTDFRKELSLSGILFTEDLLHWDEIKDLTPGQFLFRKMEMFSFLPDIQ